MKWTEFENKIVGIWGLGKEGQVTLKKIQEHVKNCQIKIIEEENLSDLYLCNIVIKSPGISLYRDEIKNMKEKGIKVSSGTNIFMSNKSVRTKVICITGTKGKSTTSALLAHTLKYFGLNVALGGNIGTPILSFVDDECDVAVIETSSYQCADFVGNPEIGIQMAIYPAHIKWHRSLDQYILDKKNMLEQAKRKITYEECSIKIEDKNFFDEKPIFSADSLNLIGEHNRKNACVVLEVIKYLGLDIKKCNIPFSTFKSLSHRLEIVDEIEGVKYINDSIATLPESVEAALNSFKNKKIILIFGGWDAGYDYSKLYDMFRERKITVISLPVTGDNVETLYHVKNVSEAVKKAYELATPGSVVLMSPGAPSYNQYKNFEERGDDFKKQVNSLKGIK